MYAITHFLIGGSVLFTFYARILYLNIHNAPWVNLFYVILQ